MTNPDLTSAQQPFPIVWAHVVSRWLADDPTQPQYPVLTKKQRALLRQIQPEVLAGHYMILRTASRLVREEVETNMHHAICAVFSQELGQNIQLSITIGETTAQYTGEHTSEYTSQPISHSSVHSNGVHSSAHTSPQSQHGDSAPTREKLAEEHARDFQATPFPIDEEPSPMPDHWGNMLSPGLDSQNVGTITNTQRFAEHEGNQPLHTGQSRAHTKDMQPYPPVPSHPEQSHAQHPQEFAHRGTASTHSAHSTASPGVTHSSVNPEVPQHHPGSSPLAASSTQGSIGSFHSPGVAGSMPQAPYQSSSQQHAQSPAGASPTNSDVPASGNDSGEVFMNSAYTFENFVTGSSNQMAYAACRAVAEYPGKSYNPLLIWGESGLGKTHLLHAIGHYARELRPTMRIKYVSSEELTNDFINSISTGRRDDFKRRYRNLDLLIVDDTQFLQGKESTQEEFFHTFNALHQAGKQIVLSSDRPPRQLTTLEDRLRTRFESGLITDVQSPELETRMAILSTKAASRDVKLPQEVKELIASRYEKSIRELEGALIRVVAYCSLGHEPISLQAAEVALRDIMPADEDVEITPMIVIDVVSEYFKLTPEEIVGKGRARQVANARQIGMYLCRELTDLSLPKLGAAFGGRDHTTVMYAERRIHDKIETDQKTFNQVQELTQAIKAHART